MCKELQSVREGKRECHTLDAPSPILSELDPKMYMIQQSYPLVLRGSGNCDSAWETPLNWERAICAIDAPWSLMSCRNLETSDIYLSIAFGNNEEVLQHR